MGLAAAAGIKGTVEPVRAGNTTETKPRLTEPCRGWIAGTGSRCRMTNRRQKDWCCGHYDEAGGRIGRRIADRWPVLLGFQRELALGRSAKFNPAGLAGSPPDSDADIDLARMKARPTATTTRATSSFRVPSTSS
jgi:hypothetical protein